MFLLIYPHIYFGFRLPIKNFINRTFKGNEIAKAFTESNVSTSTDDVNPLAIIHLTFDRCEVLNENLHILIELIWEIHAIFPHIPPFQLFYVHFDYFIFLLIYQRLYLVISNQINNFIN